MREPTCPDPNDLGAFLEGRAAGAVRDHIAGCPACAEQVRELQALRQELPVAAPPGSEVRARNLVPARPRRMAPVWTAVAAAGLALSYVGYRLGEEAFFRRESAMELSL